MRVHFFSFSLLVSLLSSGMLWFLSGAAMAAFIMLTVYIPWRDQRKLEEFEPPPPAVVDTPATDPLDDQLARSDQAYFNETHTVAIWELQQTLELLEARAEQPGAPQDPHDAMIDHYLFMTHARLAWRAHLDEQEELKQEHIEAAIEVKPRIAQLAHLEIDDEDTLFSVLAILDELFLEQLGESGP